MLETEARGEMDDPVVQGKAELAREWCEHASEYLLKIGGKPWRYVLIAHDEVVENRSLKDY